MSLIETWGQQEPRSGALGLAGIKTDPRTLRAGAYFPSKALTLPVSVDHSKLVSNYGMLLNDSLGDCVPAGALHTDEVFSAIAGYKILDTYQAGQSYRYKDPEAEFLYEKIGNYVPGDPSTDQGCYLIDMLNYWHKTGLPITGHKLAAFASVDPTNAVEVKSSIYEFGVAYIALNLPLSAQAQSIWDVPKGGTKGRGAPGSWGGHCVPIVAYDGTHLAVVTWGGILLMTWAFLGTYCVEAYAMVSYDQMKSGKSNLGFNYTQLITDLKTV